MDKIPLPSLAAIRVFEAAARRLSYTRAAEELGMTQAAVSHQIKSLEARLGAPVFQREGRGVALTRAGSRLAEAATEAMTLIRDAVAEVRQGDEVLAVTVLPTLASTWLVPRLGAFQLAHPELAVKLDSSNRLVDLAREDIDVGIRAGRGEWPGIEAHFLFPTLYTAVCSPEFLERHGPFCCPSELRRAPLIGDPREWRAWFHAAGVEPQETDVAPRQGYEVQTFDVAAALAGDGLALASPIYYAGDIAAGRLARPFDHVWRDRSDYWLVYPKARRNAPKIRAFREWLLAAVAADPVVGAETARAR